MDKLQGKIVRINPDGSIPKDNPFVGTAGARPEIWSLGHRNVQAAAINPATGELWEVEHGTRGGDELNIVRKGKNYGWPVATFGEEYSGQPIPDSVTDRAGFEPPVYYWDPVIAPSGMEFYAGKAFKAWRGSVFIGGLASKRLVRLVIKDNRVVGEEHLLTDRGQRLRDEGVVAQQRHLAAGATEALDSVRGRRQQQHPARVGGAEHRDVDRQRFAVRAPCHRMHVVRDGQSKFAGRGLELVARLGIQHAERALEVAEEEGKDNLNRDVPDTPPRIADARAATLGLVTVADAARALELALAGGAATRSGIDPASVIGIGTDFTACTVLPVLADGTPLCSLPAYRNRPHAWTKLWKHHAAQPEANKLNATARTLGYDFLDRYGGGPFYTIYGAARGSWGGLRGVMPECRTHPWGGSLLPASGNKAVRIGGRVVVEPPAIGVLAIKLEKVVQATPITAAQLAPAFWHTSITALASFSALRPLMATRAPSRTNASTMPLPKPSDPPVTRTTLSLKRIPSPIS